MTFNRTKWQRERKDALRRAGGRRICLEIPPDANAVLRRLQKRTGWSAARIIRQILLDQVD